MERLPVNSIDDVISTLDIIIREAELNNDPLGYFAVLYQKVTVKVKEGIAEGYFDDGERMERLDVIFAKRYIDAWFCWKENEYVTLSWKKAFVISGNNDILVFQHLLLGMNAHINLDLGLAVAEISSKEDIHLIHNDFIKINQILSSLVSEVQHSLSSIWPMLTRLLSRTGRVDDFLVDFSMKVARDGAWEFATQMALLPVKGWQDGINNRDIRVSDKTKLITEPGRWVKFLFWIIRLGERGTVKEKIGKLKAQAPSSLNLKNVPAANLQYQ